MGLERPFFAFISIVWFVQVDATVWAAREFIEKDRATARAFDFIFAGQGVKTGWHNFSARFS